MKKLIPLSLIALFLTPTLLAETIYLKDGEKLSGKILSYYEDKFVIDVTGKGKYILPKDRIERITFSKGQSKNAEISKEEDSSPDKPHFSSPVKTFMHWKKSAIKGDLEEMASCFIFPAKEDQLAQLRNFSKKQIKEMKKKTKKTDFRLAEPLYDGGKAYLSVTRKYKNNSKTEIIEFQREGKNWKMVPN